VNSQTHLDSAAKGRIRLRVTGRPVPEHSRARFNILAPTLITDDGNRHEFSIGTSEVNVGLGDGSSTNLDWVVQTGAFDRLEFDLKNLELMLLDGTEWQALDAEMRIDIPLGMSIDVVTPLEVNLELNATEFLKGEVTHTSAFSAEIKLPGVCASFLPRGGQKHTLEFGGLEGGGPLAPVRLNFSGDTFPANSRIDIRRKSSESIPALFQHQRPLGPVMEISSTARASGWIEITLPYDDALIGKTRESARNLVVLQLDTDRSVYTEHRPVRIDTRQRTLTIQTRTLSLFFPGPPGFTVDYPHFHQSAGETVHYTLDETLTLAGGSQDSTVQFFIPGFSGGFSRAGRFHFSGVPLPFRGDNLVRLRAVARGGVAHEAELLVRHAPPRRLVTSPNALYAPELSPSPDNIPFITAGVNQIGRYEFEAGLIELLETWQTQWHRPGYYLYRFDPGLNDWPWVRMLPDAWFENEAAGLLIGDMNLRFGAGGFHIPKPPPASDGLHNLRQLTLHVLGSQVPEYIQYARDNIDRVASPFARGNLVMSANAPLLHLNENRVQTVFVAATASGISLSRSSRIGSYLASRYNSLFRDLPHERVTDPFVGVGRFFYMEIGLPPPGSNQPVKRTREVIAEDIWCHRVVMRLNPSTGNPAVLALGALPDDEQGNPRSSLRLFTRVAEGGGFRWVDEEVWSGRPIVDADFDFDPERHIRIVARVYDESDLDRQLYELRRRGGGWQARAVLYESAEVRLRETGFGVTPRIVIDRRGRSLIGIVGARLVPIWFVLVESGTTWQAVVVNGLLPSNLADHDDNFDFTQDNRLNANMLAPAMTLMADSRLLLAHTDGTLQLAEIDLERLEVSTSAVDVDRLTGLSPSIAITPRGTVGIAYKDAWGTGERGGGATQHLFYFNTGDGLYVPSRQLPFPPGMRQETVNLRWFAPHVPIGRNELVNFDTAGDPALQDRLVRSILLDRKFHVLIVPGEHDFDGIPRLAIERSHPEILDVILNLDTQPQITQLTLDNSDFADEPVSRIHITSFGRLALLSAAHADALNMGDVPTGFEDELQAAGLPGSMDRSYDVTRLREGEWDILVGDPFGVSIIVEPIPAPPGTTVFVRSPTTLRYLCRLTEDGIEVTLGPLVTIVDQADTRDADGRAAPLAVSQWTYDTFGQNVSRRFVGIGLNDFPDDLNRAKWLELSDIRITDVAAFDPGTDQNGSIRFTMTVDRIYSEGRQTGADFTVESTEPTVYYIDFAPFVDRDSHLDWYLRRVLQTGHLEVSIDIFSGAAWLLILSVVLFPWSLIVKLEVLEDVQERVDEGFRDVEPGNIPELLLTSFLHFVDEFIHERELAVSQAGGFPATVDDENPLPRIEAVWLRDRFLHYWIRGAARPEAIIHLVPETINFGVTPVNGPAVERNILITNSGSIPILVNSIVISPGANEFSVVASTILPQPVTSENSLAAPLRFRPISNPGPRERTISVAFSDGRTLHARAVAVASEAVFPDLMLIAPSIVTFGIVHNGQVVVREVEVQNVGQVPLTVQAPVLLADQGRLQPFQLNPSTQFSLSPGAGRMIQIRFSPNAPAPEEHRARLRISSNDPDSPVRDVNIYAVSGGPQGQSGLLLRASETHFDFGRVRRGPAFFGVRYLNIFNFGSTRLTIVRSSLEVVGRQGGPPSVHYDVTGLQGVPLPSTDIMMPPSTGLDLLVFFRPFTSSLHTGTISVAAIEAPGKSLKVTVEGVGID
jgi:hypothetical protein